MDSPSQTQPPLTAPACAPMVESRRPPCPVCQAPMEPEHAHHKCPACGYIEPCCGW
jgi:tRNA(Ile2) C34 agmatinyltransferase TiaS